MLQKNLVKFICSSLTFLSVTLLLGGCQKNGSIKAIGQVSTDNMSHKVSIRPEEIEEINSYVKSVEGGLKLYVKCEDTIFGLTTEGTSVVSYYGDNHLVKLKVVYYGEGGKFEEIIYMKDDRVVFIKDLDTSYNVPIYIEGSKISSEIPSQIYFKDQKMVAWINNGETIAPASEKFFSMEKQWHEEIKDLKIEEMIGRGGCALKK